MYNHSDIEGRLLSDLNLAGTTHFLVSNDLDYVDVSRRALAGSFLKKFLPMGTSVEPDRRALDLFKAVNQSLPCVPFVFPVETSFDDYAWDYFRSNLAEALGDYLDFPDNESSGLENIDVNTLLQWCGVGPGAAQKADSANFYTKLFTGEMSVYSESVIPLYRAALAVNDTWAVAEKQRFQEFGFTVVKGTKIFFAPKNNEISRVCGTEANCEMFMQKGLGGFLESRLKAFFDIDLSKQQVLNRSLTRQGSIDGSFGTIDLSSASDRIGIHMFRAALPNCAVKRWVEMLRSPHAIFPDGQQCELRMVSTMGNGFTFPLQTLIFACAVKSVYQLCDIPFKNGVTVGVFGDDMVVERSSYHLVVRLLTKLGLVVNDSKSFNEGHFRESCGGDYYHGHNVRGVYLKQLQTPQDVATLFNRLTRWSARNGWDLPKTYALLHSWRIKDRIPLVPPHESDDAGFKVPFVKSRPKVNHDYWFKYRKMIARVDKVEMEISALKNQNGALIFMLGGYASRPDREITDASPATLYWDPARVPRLRVDQEQFSGVYGVPLRAPIGAIGRHKIRHCATPYWDWPGVGDMWEHVSHEAWNTFMTCN